MRHLIRTASAFGFALSLGLVGVTGTFAKGHDQGVGDTDPPGAPTEGIRDLGVTNEGGSSFIVNPLDPSAFGDKLNNGVVGTKSSDAKDGNSGTHGDNAGTIDELVP